jgi:ribosomal protein L11 methyltransferase
MNIEHAPRWFELAVEVPCEAEEAAADILRRFAPRGVAIETSGEAVVVKAWLPDDSALAAQRRAVRRALASLPATVHTRWLREEDWAEAWKAFFPVLHVSPQLVICPAWRSYRARRGEAVVRLDPGMAFGTGQHPTTLMCLRALEETVRPGAAVLDLGTGSSVLALAAARFGAANVLALDNDPMAVRAARENVRLNGLEAAVRVEEGTLGAGMGPFDIVVANISAPAIVELAVAIVEALRPGGVLIAGGFSETRSDEVAAALASAGLSVERTLSEGEWRTVVGGRNQPVTEPYPAATDTSD